MDLINTLVLLAHLAYLIYRFLNSTRLKLKTMLLLEKGFFSPVDLAAQQYHVPRDGSRLFPARPQYVAFFTSRLRPAHVTYSRTVYLIIFYSSTNQATINSGVPARCTTGT